MHLNISWNIWNFRSCSKACAPVAPPATKLQASLTPTANVRTHSGATAVPDHAAMHAGHLSPLPPALH
eukprot:795423-Amphidinium_carterae.1